MPSRLLALLLALVLMWSGASTHESVVLAWSGDDEVVELIVKPVVPLSGSGSLDDHHLDDQPSLQGDVQVDRSTLPSAAPPPPVPPSAVHVPAAAPARRLASPYLDGLHRPPDASPVA